MMNEQQEKKITDKELKETINFYKDLTGDVIDYAHHLFIALTFHSTKIEGSTYDLTETKTLLEKNITAEKDFISANMILDHFEALNYVVEMSGKKIIPDENIIKRIAGMVKKTTGKEYHNILGSCDESKGDYRVNLVTVGSEIVTFPAPQKIKPLMAQLVKDLNKDLLSATSLQQKLNIAFKIHYDLVMIHPFSDGNGRTARLMMNYILNYFDLPLFTINANIRTEYIKTLENTYKTDDFNLFYDFSKKEYYNFLMEQIKTITKNIKTLNFYKKRK